MFKTYVLFLILSGIAMLVIAGIRTGQTRPRRLWNAIFGAGFLGYGLYLLLVFRSGHYFIFIYAFILPVLMIVRFFRDRGMVRARQQRAVFPAPPTGYGQPTYGQPTSYGQPTYGQPGDQPQDPAQ
ncbi:MAG: hypothetical protein WBH47_20710 [Streptosporangiaceae bacterium]